MYTYLYKDEEEIPMRLSEIVKQYRQEHGLSIRQFARLCDLSHAAVANIESEKNSYGNPYVPSMETLQKVSTGLGISLMDPLSAADDMEISASPTDEIRDELKDNPELRVLLSAAADLTKEDLIALTEIAKRFHR